MMIFVTNSKRMWLAGTLVSLVIFAVIYFTVIKPSTDTANQVLRTGLNQSQQVIRQAQSQISSAAGSGSPAAGKALNRAAKLSSCVAAAGTDASKLQSCEATYSQ